MSKKKKTYDDYDQEISNLKHRVKHMEDIIKANAEWGHLLNSNFDYE